MATSIKTYCRCTVKQETHFYTHESLLQLKFSSVQMFLFLKLWAQLVAPLVPDGSSKISKSMFDVINTFVSWRRKLSWSSVHIYSADQLQIDVLCLSTSQPEEEHQSRRTSVAPEEKLLVAAVTWFWFLPGRRHSWSSENWGSLSGSGQPSSSGRWWEEHDPEQKIIQP